MKEPRLCMFSHPSDGAIQNLTYHQGAASRELTVIFVLRIRVNNGGKEVASLFTFDLAEDGL